MRKITNPLLIDENQLNAQLPLTLCILVESSFCMFLNSFSNDAYVRIIDIDSPYLELDFWSITPVFTYEIVFSFAAA